MRRRTFFFSFIWMALLIVALPILGAGAPDEAWRTRFQLAGHGQQVGWEVEILTDGSVMVAGQDNDGISIVRYDSSGSQISSFGLEVSGYLTGFDLSPDGQAAVIAQSWGGFNWDWTTILIDGLSGVKLWESSHNGTGNGNDYPRALLIDGNGDVVVTGQSYRSTGNFDYATVKYSGSAGTMLWESTYNGTGNNYDYATALAIDSTGNVVVTGQSYGSSGNSDYATVKYSGSAGTQVWASIYNGTGNNYDYATALAIDSTGNVVVTGQSYGSSGNSDYATVKYSGSAGTQVWASIYNGTSNNNDYAAALAIDGNGDVVATGYSYGSNGNYDYATVKYAGSAGTQLWASMYNGASNNDDVPTALATDGNGDIVVTGYSYESSGYYDYATMKYSGAAGTLVWVSIYNGTGNNYDYPRALAIDGSGDVVVTGQSPGSSGDHDYVTMKYSGSTGIESWVGRFQGLFAPYVDITGIKAMDDGSVVATGSFYSEGNYDFVTSRFASSNGMPLWTAIYDGEGNSTDYSRAIGVDANGDVVVTGQSIGSSGYYDYATVKYSGSAGILVWESIYNGTGNNYDDPRALTTDANGDVVVTGRTYGSSGGDNYATVKYSSAAGAPLWESIYNGTGNNYDLPTALAIDQNGDVVVTGHSIGSSGGYNYATLKYSGSIGAQIWEAIYNGTGNNSDFTTALAIDGNGDVVVTGQSFESSGGYNYATLKYSAADGAQQWVAVLNRYHDYPVAVAIDSDGDAIVTGYSYYSSCYWSCYYNQDFLTAKFDGSTGSLQWQSIFSRGDYDRAAGLVLTPAGSAVVTGTTQINGQNVWGTIGLDGTNGALEWGPLPSGPGDARKIDSAGSRLFIGGRLYNSSTIIAYDSGDFAPDADGDGIADDSDSCPSTPNPDQTDTDGDGSGDVCDTDDDNDGFADENDCDPLNPLIHTSGTYYADPDGDGIGNLLDYITVCGDGTPPAGYVSAADDNCPTTSNADQTDTDGDGIGDACDACALDPDNDIDGDGVCSDVDNCSSSSNPDQADADVDGIGDVCDTDHAPVASDDSYVTNEDEMWELLVLANDVDRDGNTLSIASVSSAANGLATIHGDKVHYMPNANYHGDDSFQYVVSDGSGNSDSATVFITVNPVNDAPVAAGDTASGDEETAITGNVLSNDSDIDGDTLTAVLVTGVSNGTLTLNPDGSFSYTPSADYNGTDSFSYKASDGAADSNVVTFSITVNPVNDAPVAASDGVSGDEDTTIAGNVLSNDGDVDGDALGAVLVSDVSNGTLTLNPDGSFSYAPSADYNGVDSFSYKANDGAADSNVVTVSITVNPVNDTPVALDDSVSGDEDTTITGSVLANDSDIDGDALAAALVSGVANGMLTLNPDGSFTYTPDADYNGGDSFSYKANDGAADSNVATVSIAVNPVNDAPVAVDDTASGDEDTTITGSVLANDSDIDANALTAVLVSDVTNGALTLNADGSFSYTPDADYNGGDSFSYKANDGAADSNVVTVTITVIPVNDAPVAVDDSASGDEDTTIAGNVLTNDNDVDGDPLTVSLVGDVSNGALTLSSDGSFSYTPAADYNGSDSFTYKANDTLLDSNVATVTIAVIPVNDAPVLAAIGNQSVDEETMLSFTASATDVDVPSNVLSFSLIGAPSGASIDGSTGVFTWTPSESQGQGSYTFTVRVDDNGAPPLHAAEEITVVVNEVNVAPVLGAISNGTTQWGDEITFTASATDHDTPSNILTFSLSGAPAGASIDGSGGVFTWTPASDQIGSHSFDVVVTDDGDPVLSDSQSVTITVTKRATTLVYGGDLDEQYSDTTDVLATLTDSGWGTGIDGRTIDFDIGSQSTSALTGAAGVATSTITIDQEPGGLYFVDAIFNGDALYFPSNDSAGFTIEQEDAAVTYTGTVFTSTYCEECSGASVLLAATVQDITAATSAPAHDPEAGDVLNATLTFVNRDLLSSDPNYVICVAPLGLVNASDPTTAAATCQWSVDIGNADSIPYTIGMIVDGWYSRDESEDNTVVTVSKPQRDSITGGGFLVNEASAGLKPGQDGKKTNFGFNVKYNKSGKKLQGQINIIVRNQGRVYQLKGNVMSSLSVNRATNQAVFNGKANIQDITDPDAPIAVDGNATLQVEMTDRGEPGSDDTIGITLWDKDGGVWFSSHWNGVRTIEQPLDGGNLRVQ